MDRKRKLEIYEVPPQPAGAPPANGPGMSYDAEPTVNPYNGRPYSQRYYQILAGRKGEQGWGLLLLCCAHRLPFLLLLTSGVPLPLRPHPKSVGLPVWQAKGDFVNMLNQHQTIILVGETGSGKTTQVRRCRPCAAPGCGRRTIEHLLCAHPALGTCIDAAI